MQTQAAPRRPGELVFSAAVFAASVFLLWTAFRISGFEALSAPGTVPMVTTGLMTLTSGMVMVEAFRKPATTSEKIERDILPMPVVATVVLIAAYAVLLKPLGFIPTSFLFLAAMIRLLSGGGTVRVALIAALAVLGVWIVFRLVFSVLMPPGIVPEGQIVAFFRNLLAGV